MFDGFGVQCCIEKPGKQKPFNAGNKTCAAVNMLWVNSSGTMKREDASHWFIWNIETIMTALSWIFIELCYSNIDLKMLTAWKEHPFQDVQTFTQLQY